jgi:thioredoxin-related protein
MFNHNSMKNNKILSAFILLGLFSLGLSENTDGGDVDWKEFNRGVELAKKDKKYIIIDFYTDWCGWCKKMDNLTYSDHDVQRLLSAHYISIKVNAEDEKQSLVFDGKTFTYPEFTQYLGINGFPTTVFLDPDGKAITKVPGFIEKEKMSKILKYFSSESYKKQTFDEYIVRN